MAGPDTSFILILFITRNKHCSVTIKCTFPNLGYLRLSHNVRCALSSTMWIKAKAIKASYDQRVVWTQSNIVLLSWAAVEHLRVFVCAQLHAEPSSQGAHNCWSCVQTLQPRCLFSVSGGALGFTQSGDVFICASIQESGPAFIVRYLGEAWVNASRNQLTWLASEREPLFFRVIIHSVMFNWATWTRWQDSLTAAALCLQQTLSGGQL